MTWVAVAVAAGVGILLGAASLSGRMRLSKLRRDGRLIAPDLAEAKKTEGWALYRIEFGYGTEVWLARGEPQVDPRQLILVDGYRVFPASKDLEQSAGEFWFRGR
jgi:hypothetical protein